MRAEAIVAADSLSTERESKPDVLSPSLTECRENLAVGLSEFKLSNSRRTYVVYDSAVWLEEDAPFDEEVIQNMRELKETK